MLGLVWLSLLKFHACRDNMESCMEEDFSPCCGLWGLGRGINLGTYKAQ